VNDGAAAGRRRRTWASRLRWVRPRTLQTRLALLFALATLVLCALVGVVAVQQFNSQLRSALDDGLHARLSALVRQLPKSPNNERFTPLLPDTESFAQVIRPDGTVLAAAPRALYAGSVLSRSERQAALRGRQFYDRTVLRGGDQARLLAGQGNIGSEPVVLVVGASLEDTTRAVKRLESTLLVGLPIIAILVSIGGWFLAGSALSPVRSMIEEADAISAAQLASRAGERSERWLSVPRTGEEIAELARRLNALLARIEDAITHERAFLDDASHELRTPIAIARGEAELARMAVVDDSEAAAALDSLLEEVDRLDHLARNLLVLARTRAAPPASWPEIDLADVAHRAVDAVERAGDGDGVRVYVEGEATVRGDESGLERAVANLVQNALRAARTRVDVRISSDDGGATLEVADDGPGFPPDVLPRAFERFTHEPGPAGSTTGGSVRTGAGLGLAIVAAIAAAHGGRAFAANTPDGAVVRLVLPRRTP